jgi:hypothetical protein
MSFAPNLVPNDTNGQLDVFARTFTPAVQVATLTLTPVTATNPVNTTHSLLATVRDNLNAPVAGIVVRAAVTGSVNTNLSCTTAANGNCALSYLGPTAAGSDAIAGYADVDNDSTADVGEPTASATKTWVYPVPTTKNDCKDNWQNLTDDTGKPFKNQGDCNKFFNGTNKKN